MASNIDEQSSSVASTIPANVVQSNNEGRMNNRHASCRRKLLFIARLLFILLCLAYNLYLLWLLAYLKDNRNYWLLSLLVIPYTLVCARLLSNPSPSVTLTLMMCFTMLSRLAYYHRHQDDFIGPRFVIASLKGSIILILLGFILTRDCKMELLLKDKDTVSRAVFDFVDIFNMAEVLSANECGGLGSFLFEESSTEMAIQAFCTLSFLIVNFALWHLHSEVFGRSESIKAELYLYVLSIIFQNIPFLVIRILIWVRFNTFNLGFVVKNVISTVFCFANSLRLMKVLLNEGQFFVLYRTTGEEQN